MWVDGALAGFFSVLGSMTRPVHPSTRHPSGVFPVDHCPRVLGKQSGVAASLIAEASGWPAISGSRESRSLSLRVQVEVGPVMFPAGR